MLYRPPRRNVAWLPPVPGGAPAGDVDSSFSVVYCVLLLRVIVQVTVSLPILVSVGKSDARLRRKVSHREGVVELATWRILFMM